MSESCELVSDRDNDACEGEHEFMICRKAELKEGVTYKLGSSRVGLRKVGFIRLGVRGQ